MIVDGISFEDRLSIEVLGLLENYVKFGKLRNVKKPSNEEDKSMRLYDNSSSTHHVEINRIGSKAKKQKVRRPIFLICNNIYDRHLISLKMHAITFKIRKPDNKKLLSRIMEICNSEHIRIDEKSIKRLIIESNYDISSCLNVLQFVSSNKSLNHKALKEIFYSDLFDHNDQFRFHKDMSSSIFDTWDRIMRVKSKFDK